MKIYLYGIIDFNDKIDSSIKGLGGANVYNIPYQDIGVVASNLNSQVEEITPDRAVLHEEVVEILMERFTVLPIRFLTVFDRKKDILSMMEDHHRDFRENLDRLRNKVEFGVKVIWPGDRIKKRIAETNTEDNHNLPKDNTPVKSFVKEKFEKFKIEEAFQKEADRYITFVDKFFNKIASEKRLEKLKTDILLLNASYLIEKEKQNEFRRAYEQLRSAKRDFKYLYSGPWPPYNFIILKKKYITEKPSEEDMPDGISLGQDLTKRQM